MKNREICVMLGLFLKKLVKLQENQMININYASIRSWEFLLEIGNYGLLNNTNNYIIQRQNFPSDAEVLSNIIGTHDQFVVTSQIAAKGSTGTGSIRETKEFIIHPDKIKRLARGEAIFVNKQRFLVQEMAVRKSLVF